MTQPPIEGKQLMRAGLAGLILAGVGIGLFVLIWNAFSGLSDFPRLFAAICIPPAVIAAMLGVYMLVVRPNQDH
jgi:hypothetical protein